MLMFYQLIKGVGEELKVRLVEHFTAFSQQFNKFNKKGA